MSVLITGGAGFIGSHTCVKLLEADHDIVVIDNLSNSHKIAIDRIKQITNKEFPFYNDSAQNEDALRAIFKENNIKGVIHFAGYKSVGESVSNPLKYYDNNINSTLTLLKVMSEYAIKNLVFSSSATVYGNPIKVPIQEEFPLEVTNPYGMTKLMIETILKDLYRADSTWNIAILRYFNPVGAHPSGLIGEDPNGMPNNLAPYITQVAIGKFEKVKVFGNDYPTKDGTGVRDYVHVQDLAEGHLAALDKLDESCGLKIYNLGTGHGYSVLEIINAFSEATGKVIPYEFTKRRDGDVASCYANPEKACQELSWTAKRGLYEMCRDAWNWQQKNPNGYSESELK